jgi:hypothetical protein
MASGRETRWFMIDGFFKRKVLLEAGTFNPYLRSNEEGELSYRILAKGYKLLRLPQHMSHHMGCRENIWRYLKKSLLFTIGQGRY